MRNRAWGVYCAMLSLFAAAFWSASHISGSPAYVAAAAGQSAYRLDVAESRGMIYDCRMQPLVNRETRTVAAVAPTIEAIGALEQATDGAQRERLATALEDGKPFLMELREEEARAVAREPMITLFDAPVRYEEDQPAAHVIGTVDGLGEGVSGVELAMDDLLRSGAGRASVTYQVDALGRVIAGGGKKVTDTLEETVGGVALTLDLDLQRLAEQAGEKLGKGAVVITEVPGCEVRAMASFPDYSPLDLESAAQAEDAPFLNRAMSPYAPGSVFKLIPAAAALESGVTLQKHECTGSINAGGMLFHCYGGMAHGTVDLKGALEKSCNCYFINLVRGLGPQAVLNMAYELGLGSETEFGRGLFSDGGTLPQAGALSNARALANFSFGQGETTATPLQLCAMCNAIAAGGVYTSPRLILGTVSAGGELTEVHAVTEQSRRVMKERTALLLRQAMEGAVREGTARAGAPRGKTAGVKTGTAQTGVYEDGKELLNFWYCGYVCDETGKPRYSITVLCEGTADDGGQTARVFQQIAEELGQARR